MREHMRKRGKKWYLVVELPRGVEGKRKHKWIPLAETRKESERAASRIMRDIDACGSSQEERKTKEKHDEDE